MAGIRVPASAASELRWGLPAAVVLAAATFASPYAGLGLGLVALAVGLLTSMPAVAGVALAALLCDTGIRAGGLIASNIFVGVLGLLGLVALLRRTERAAQPQLWAASTGPVVYLLLITPSALLHPSSDGVSAVLLQRPTITVGAVLAGFWLVRAGGIKPLLTTLYLGTTVIAVASLPAAATGGTAYPLGLHKNYAGPLLATVLLIRLVPHRLPAPAALKWPHIVLLALGLYGTQSRSAILGLLVASIYYALRSKGGSVFLRRVFVVSGSVAGLVTLGLLISTQLSSGNKFNSAATRPADAAALFSFFVNHPLLGVGPENIFGVQIATAFGTGFVSAPSLVLQSLAEAGLLGGIAVAALALQPFRLKLGEQTMLIRTLVVFRLVGGEFDFYWVAGSTAVVWLLIGAAATLHPAEELAEEPGGILTGDRPGRPQNAMPRYPSPATATSTNT